MRFVGFLAALLVVTSLAGAPSAHAQLSAGGQVGYGVGLNADPDPYRLLLGARAGWNFDALYLGGNVSFFAGEKREGTLGTTAARQVQVLGADVGYDVEAGPMVFRPLFGVGGTVGLFKAGGRRENQGAAYLNFGAETFGILKDVIFLGGGMRFISTFFDPDNVNGFSFYLLSGMYFDFQKSPAGGGSAPVDDDV